MKKIVTLIGTRYPPKIVCPISNKIGKAFSDKGWIGRSGRAIGMDYEFMKLYDPKLAEIYRPDNKFKEGINVTKFENFFEAEEMVKNILPHFQYLDFYSQWLHVRNAYQILGRDLNTPSDLVICYSTERKGVIQGGTRTATTIAKRRGIPVVNLWHYDNMKKICDKFDIEVPEFETHKQIDLSFLE